jgi:predicted ATPase
VFGGGWDLEAETVGFGPELSRGEVVDVLSNLVDHSLVMAEPEADGGMRYRLLEPVRQYAHERLEARGESTAIGRRHAEHFLTVHRHRADAAGRARPGELPAVTADGQLRGGDQVRWLHRVSPF